MWIQDFITFLVSDIKNLVCFLLILVIVFSGIESIASALRKG